MTIDEIIIEFSFFFAVKYLREVTPYFRAASIISEVGWELQRGFLSAAPPPPAVRPRRPDARLVPLLLAYVARGLRHPDQGTVVLLNIVILV